LLDLQSMGYDADAVVKTLLPPAAKALVNYFTQNAKASDPIGCVGYSYAMERLATGIREQYIQKVESLLPPETNATRCLRVHSGVGADAEHVEETVEMVASLTDGERIRIANACYQTALLCFSPPHGGYISSKQLQYLLKPLKLGNSATI
jgi:pyrroloquinoline quinone (PQQ) biosynthesis protein C